MEEALQAISDSNDLFQYGRSFSPTNLSFGQGSPMSRGSMMDSLQQDLDSNALQLV
jgi:hypothetical protein